MTTNADITVYNSFLNPDTRLKEWRRTVIKKAWFYVDNKVSVTDGGLASADSFKVRIPVDAEFSGSHYVAPEEYTGKENTWILKNDDYIARGAIAKEIEKPSDLQKELYQVFKITSWSDNRFGSLQHWRVGGI